MLRPSEQMLRPTGRYSPTDRVRKRTEYLRIQQAGHRVVSPGFVFMLERAVPSRGPRLGITASRRVGNAVERNRAKRLVREAFRAVRSSWPAGVDVVVIVRHALGNKKLADVVAEWQSARGRIVRRFEQLPEAAPRPNVADLGPGQAAASPLKTGAEPAAGEARRQ